MKINYRPEIDGLRTIAVISVVIYHLQIFFGSSQFLRGGFLGVDIFFVISGFLITSIIIGEINQTGSFSFSNFYERRLRRLLPALLIVIIATLPVAWYILLPEQLVDFSKSVISSLAFGSNFYWHFSLQEYGAESALLQPFLHTWSLAVEEQFYFIYPVFLLFIYKWYRQYRVVLLTAVLLISLQFAELVTPQNHSLSFYMLPSRLWELLAGGLLAHVSSYQPSKENNAFLSQIMPILGLYLILHSLLFTDFDSSTHPGFATVSTIVGTMLIIFFASEKDLVTRVLSSRLFIFVGLISYSLYLWHYPIFAFGRIIDPSPTWQDKILWVFLAFALSIMTYYLIEKPFRSSKKISNRTALFASLLLLIPTAGISSSWIINRGSPDRMPQIIAELSQNYKSTRTCITKTKTKCVLDDVGKQQIFLVGDSHMHSLENALLAHTQAFDYKLTSLVFPGCQYILNLSRVNINNGQPHKCNRSIQMSRREVLLNSEPGIIIIGGRLPVVLQEDGFDNLEGGYEGKMPFALAYPNRPNMSKKTRSQAIRKEYTKTIMELAEYGHKVVITYPIPEVGWHVPKELQRRLRGLTPSEMEAKLQSEPITTNFKAFKQRTKSSFEVLDQIRHPNLSRVYSHTLFCDKPIKDRCITHNLQTAFYRDEHHLSPSGAQSLIELIVTSNAFSKSE